MPPVVRNIFAGVSRRENDEDFLTLFENASAKIERIVSCSQASPADFWYDQSWDEWVMVLRGSATLEFEGDEFVELGEGDCVAIARRVRHRVARTGAETVWLAIHVK